MVLRRRGCEREGERGRAVYGGVAALRDGSSSLSLPKSGEAMVQIHHGGQWGIVDLINAEKG